MLAAHRGLADALSKDLLMRALLLTLLCLSLIACQGPKKDEQNPTDRPKIDPNKVVDIPPPERDRKLKQAVGFIEGGDVGAGLTILYELNEANPKDEQVLYILGRTLLEQGSFRAARNELLKLTALNPDYALAWQRLGDIYQRLGEHKEAIEAFRKVATLVPQTIEPLRRIAANYLIRGEPQRALEALIEARSRVAEKQSEDVVLEYLTARVYEQLGNSDEARAAAREFLRLSEGDGSFEEQRAYYRRWLQDEGLALSEKDARDLLRYARATLLRTTDGPGSGPEIAKEAGPRLTAFDNTTTVFVTLRPARGLGDPLVSKGREESLLGSVARALAVLMTNPKANKSLARRASLSLTVVSARFDPIVLEATSTEGGGSGFRAVPAVELGRHGLTFDAGTAQPFVLPCEAVTEDLESIEAMLRHAATRARLTPNAWKGRPAYRFTARTYVEPAPGAGILTLEEGEPLPWPLPSWQAIYDAVTTAGDWLVRQQLPSGALPAGYDPHRARLVIPSAEARALEILELEDTSTLNLRITSPDTKPAVVGGLVLIPCADATREGLARRLVQVFGLDPEAIVIGDGILTEEASVSLRGVSAERVRAMVAAATDEDKLDHWRGVAALAVLSRRTSRAAYRAAAERGARWALGASAAVPSAASAATALRALALIDAGRLDDSQAPAFRADRARLAGLLSGETALAPVLLSAEPRVFGEGLEGLLEQAILAADARLAEQVEAAALARLASWPKGELAPREPSFARALARLAEQSTRPEVGLGCLRIAEAYGPILRDPGVSRREGGGVSPKGAFPLGDATAHANLALSAAARAANRGATSPDTANPAAQFRTASLAAAGFQLRHRIRPEHGFYLPDIGAAVGAFRRGLYDGEVTITGQHDELLSLCDVLTLIRQAGEAAPGAPGER